MNNYTYVSIFILWLQFGYLHLEHVTWRHPPQKSPTINYGTQGEEFLSDFLKCELKKIQKYNSEGSELWWCELPKRESQH